MAPSMTVTSPACVLQDVDNVKLQSVDVERENPKLRLVWKNIIIFAYLHLSALYGLTLMFSSAKLATSIFDVYIAILGGAGITAGAHRLWSHRSYKAKWPLRIILVCCNTIAIQNSVIEWCRDHRMHHKYSETDADPHNAKRGFFFSHMGWLLCRKHPMVSQKGKDIDMSDLWSDPILRFQKKYYSILVVLFAVAIPIGVPMYFWNETFKNALFLNLFRLCCSLNFTWLVNSAAHLWGRKPYDKTINPAENLMVNLCTWGEGFHNYHHTFPWDYNAAEMGLFKLNCTSQLINFFAKIGWAYDLKTVSQDVVKKRVWRTGDGTHEIWGWGDKDQNAENHQAAVITYQRDY